MKYILFLIVTTISTVFPTPFQFPDNSPQQRNGRVESRAYSKPNANYNRLIFNRITVQQNDDDIDDYDDSVVQPDNAAESNTSPPTTASTSQDADDNNDVSSDGSRRRRRKPYCIPFQVPFQHNGGYFRDANGYGSKTFSGINVINQHYNLNNGYPNYDGYGDSQGDNKPTNDNQNSPIYNQNNHHAGYGCIPIYYGNHHGINRPHHRPPGGHFGNRPGGDFGSFGNRPGYGGFGSGYRPGGIFSGFNGGGNRPQGGPFGFFGQGGLFDLTNIFGGNNGGGVGDNGDSTASNIFNRPISSIQNNRPTVTNLPSTSTNNNQEIFSDSVSDDNIKPVFEINVPDTIQEVTNNIRPFVGGIANQVTGFFQQLATQPDQTVQRINREFNSYLRPIYGFF